MPVWVIRQESEIFEEFEVGGGGGEDLKFMGNLKKVLCKFGRSFKNKDKIGEKKFRIFVLYLMKRASKQNIFEILRQFYGDQNCGA